MTRNIFKSSAKSRNSEKLILVHNSLIRLLKDRGYKVELVALLKAWKTVRKISLKCE
jgi:hypothetical protein